MVRVMVMDGDGCLGAYFGIAYVVRVHAQRNIRQHLCHTTFQTYKRTYIKTFFSGSVWQMDSRNFWALIFPAVLWPVCGHVLWNLSRKRPAVR